MNRNLSILFTLLMCACCFGFAEDKSIPHPGKSRLNHGRVTVSGTQFLDGAGKPLLLHGINVINKSKAEGYTRNIERSDFADIRSWGMNCVRLGIFWDGLEPEPGKIDEGYLGRIAQIVDWAEAEGLYVILDMHQDLFSEKFSDGAPAWATLDEGKPHTKTAVWSDAYYASEAVQTALDHFWANTPGPGNVGLQDRYAHVWQAVALRFRGNTAVIGFDLLNEPFPGADAARMQGASLTRLAELLHSRLGDQAPQPEKLFAMVRTTTGRRQITEWLGDMELFKSMVMAGEPIMADFERERLMPFYQRVRQAIRQVDADSILFLEPCMSANIGIPSSLTPLLDEHGHRDPQQAYAPHGYDIVVDTTATDLNSNARVELIFRRHAETSQKLEMPMLVGEWGAYYENQDCVEAARYVVQQFDAIGCGDTYWAYSRRLGSQPLRKALERSHTGG